MICRDLSKARGTLVDSLPSREYFEMMLCGIQPMVAPQGKIRENDVRVIIREDPYKWTKAKKVRNW